LDRARAALQRLFFFGMGHTNLEHFRAFFDACVFFLYHTSEK
jgi:hypothetical protein